MICVEIYKNEGLAEKADHTATEALLLLLLEVLGLNGLGANGRFMERKNIKLSIYVEIDGARYLYCFEGVEDEIQLLYKGLRFYKAVLHNEQDKELNEIDLPSNFCSGINGLRLTAMLACGMRNKSEVFHALRLDDESLSTFLSFFMEDSTILVKDFC